MPTTNEIEHLDVKTFGKVNVLTANDALTTLKGSTVAIRSGAEVCGPALRKHAYSNILKILPPNK